MTNATATEALIRNHYLHRRMRYLSEGAIRQFRHNNSSGFVMAYDITEVEKSSYSFTKRS